MKINWFGPVDHHSGYGRQAAGCVRELTRRGHQVAVWKHDVGVDKLDTDPEMLRLLARPWHADADVCLYHTVPDSFANTRLNFPDWNAERKLIAWTMWEWDRLPGDHPPCLAMPFTNWAKTINTYADALIVPGRFQQEMFHRDGVNVPIHIVHDGVDPQEWPLTPCPEYDGRHFRLFSWAYMNSRKCPWEMIDCFQEAFPRQEYPEAEFTLKTVLGQFGLGHFGVPHELFAYDPRIKIIDAFWTRAQLAQAIRQSHAVFFLSKGEGSGDPPMEALCCGRPVVCSHHSGLTEFVDDLLSEPERMMILPVRSSGQRAYPPPAMTAGIEYKWWLTDEQMAIEHLKMLRDPLWYQVATLGAYDGAEWVRHGWTHLDQVDQLEAVLQLEVC